MSFKKILTLAKFKTRELFYNKTFLISLILVPGMTFGMRLLYSNMAEGALPEGLLAMVLNLGMLYSATMIGILMPAYMLAKDKEKHTLRTLMTSSVSGSEYFIGSVLPVFVITVLLNIASLLISGLSLSLSSLGLFLIVSIFVSLVSNVIGMVIGLFSSNQMSASNNATIIMLVLLMVPYLSDIVESLKTFSSFMYTGVITNMTTSIVNEGSANLFLKDWAILLIELVLIIAAYSYFYKKNGFEKD